MNSIIRHSIAAAMVALCGGISAQAEGYWGLRLTVDANIPGKWHNDGGSMRMYGNGPGVAAGAIYHLPVSGGFYFEPGAQLYFDQYGYDITISDGDQGKALSPKVSTFGMRVPLNFGFSWLCSDILMASLFTGPELDIGFSSRITGNGSELIEPDLRNLYCGGDGGFRRMDCAWTIGLGVEFLHNYYLSISGSIGMVDLLKNPNVSYRENAVRVSLGYNF